MVVLVVVGVVVALAGGDDKDGGIDASAAAKTVAALDDEVDAESIEDGGTPLAECPVGDIRDLADLAPPGFDAADPAESDVEPIAFDVGRRSDPTSFQCNLSSEDGETLYGTVVNALPDGDVRAYIERGLPDHSVDFEDDVKHRGGTLISYCGRTDTDGGIDLCETDWVGDGIQLGVYASGDGADAELTSEWLIASLDTMIAALDKLDVDDVVTTST